MSGDNWDTIQEIFSRGADLPPFQREAFRARACKEYTRLRQGAESPLQADAEGGSALAAAIE